MERTRSGGMPMEENGKKRSFEKKKEKSNKQKKASLRIEMREQATGSQELRVSVYLSPREH